jgi:hypothetical protein
MSTTAIKGNPRPKSSHNLTWGHQCHLPKLPIPPLEDTCRRYLTALKGLQDEGEHEITIKAVEAFLHGDGPRVQEMLLEYSKDKSRCARVSCNPEVLFGAHCHWQPHWRWSSYIEEFWYDQPAIPLSLNDLISRRIGMSLIFNIPTQ